MADCAEPAPDLLFCEPVGPIRHVLAQRERKDGIGGLNGRWRRCELLVEYLRPVTVTETRLSITIGPDEVLQLALPLCSRFHVEASVDCTHGQTIGM